MASSPSPTSRCSFVLVSPFPCAYPSSRGGEGATEMYFSTSSYTTGKCEYDYFKQISTRGLMSRLLTWSGGRAVEYSGTGQCVYEGMSLKILPSLSMRMFVYGVYSYQTSYVFASWQIPRRSQGTLLPSSGEPKVSNPWNNVQCKDSI
jgi:hypothetical protein